MAIMAIAASAVAWNYAPRNEIAETNSRIGENLLVRDSGTAGPVAPTGDDDQSAYDASDVVRIVIEQYDRELDSPRKVEVTRERGSWILPDKYGFLASNAQRISGVIDSLRQAKILDMPSDQQDDHEEYGVVELGSSEAAGIGIGTTLILEDSRRNTLAQVIVGKAAADPSQRFVRIPGQPQIYVIKFDENLLSTEFADWVDGDLLRIGNQVNQLRQMLDSIEIDYYFIDPRKLANDATRTYVYRAKIYPAGERWLYDLWPADTEQKLPAQPQLTGAEVNLTTLGELLSEIVSFQLRDVQRKAATAAQDLATPEESNPVSHFEWLLARGYRHAGFSAGQHQFDSLAGTIRLRYRNGNVDTLSIGDLAGLDMQSRSNINRYLLVTCGVDESIVPVPKSPRGGNAAASGSEEAVPDNGADEAAAGEPADAQPAAEDPAAPVPQDDDAQREYQKQLNERKQMLEQASSRARNLNQIHADWLYVISQADVARLFPPVDALARPAAR
jgi:hypothetical protein